MGNRRKLQYCSGKLTLLLLLVKTEYAIVRLFGDSGLSENSTILEDAEFVVSMLGGGQTARPQLRMIAENAQCLVNWGFLWFCVRGWFSVRVGAGDVEMQVARCCKQGMLRCRLLGAASRGGRIWR